GDLGPVDAQQPGSGDAQVAPQPRLLPDLATQLRPLVRIQLVGPVDAVGQQRDELLTHGGIALGDLEVANHDEPLDVDPLADTDVLDLQVLVDGGEPALPRPGLDDLVLGPPEPLGDDEPRPARGQHLAVVLAREPGVDDPHGAVEPPPGQI